MIVLLDAGPLGLVTNPRATPESLKCKQWLVDLLAQGVRVMVPEITDYEVRRELLRAGRARGLAHLDQFKAAAGYVSITTATMLLAAEFWAQARQQGQPTAPDLALDADMILSAQAQLLAQQEQDIVVIATTNVGHLSRFATAQLWSDISPPIP
jgi:predicted nucleic acid-binding protein